MKPKSSRRSAESQPLQTPQLRLCSKFHVVPRSLPDDVLRQGPRDTPTHPQTYSPYNPSFQVPTQSRSFSLSLPYHGNPPSFTQAAAKSFNLTLQPTPVNPLGGALSVFQLLQSNRVSLLRQLHLFAPVRPKPHCPWEPSKV